ncbi:MAG: LLM class flavin-dependent oxidoreductase [Betaproteobacteria bacterium]|nr:LLM class flavin-dependent oxidoreductase [Betaproteobacteria bacterium]
MKFGLFYLPTYLPNHRDANTHYHNIMEQVEFADKNGIDYVWIVEHHFVRHGGLCSQNFSLLSYIAGRTSRIRLGTGATVLALNDPVRVAEAGGILDQLSNGRFDWGVGRGFLRDEFDAFGVEMKDSRARMEEGIDMVKRAWAEQPLNYEGKYRSLKGLNVLPSPLQRPHPPIWIACFLTKESFEWTAKEGHNLLYVAYHVNPPLAKERVGWYLDALKANGRDPKKHEVCTVYHMHCNDSDAKVRAIVEKPMAEYSEAGAEASKRPPDPEAYKGYTAREDYHNQNSFEMYFPDRVLMGDPKRIIDRIQVMKESGITQVGMLPDFGSIPHEEVMRSLKLFVDKVLPHVG